VERQLDGHHRQLATHRRRDGAAAMPEVQPDQLRAMEAVEREQRQDRDVGVGHKRHRRKPPVSPSTVNATAICTKIPPQIERVLSAMVQSTTPATMAALLSMKVLP